MNCFSGYVSLKTLSQVSPEGGYLNILPGISSELATSITTKDQLTLADLWNDVQDRSYMRLCKDVANTLLFESKADFKNVLFKTKRLLQSERNQVIVPMNTEYRGVYFSLPESRYSLLKISEVYIVSKQVVDTVFKVFDLNDSKELYSKDISLVEGLNIITVDEKFDLKYRILEVFAGIDCTEVDTIETRSEYYFLGGCSNHYGSGYHSSAIYPGRINTSDPVEYDNLELSGVGQGVVIGAEIRCNIDQFMCENKTNFHQSWLYLLGAELLNQKLAAGIGTDKLNYFTVSNREVTTETWDLFEKRYISNLKSDLKGIPIDNESMCFSCQDNLEIFTGGSLP